MSVLIMREPGEGLVHGAIGGAMRPADVSNIEARAVKAVRELTLLPAPAVRLDKAQCLAEVEKGHRAGLPQAKMKALIQAAQEAGASFADIVAAIGRARKLK